ncbi:MAG: imidazole glycerol phosphate synthase subunit HisH [Elusimicrobiota bacterium]
MITVIDYGLGNIKSVGRAFEKLGADVRISSIPEDIFDSDGIVLPGVGAFKKAKDNIMRLGIMDVLLDYLKSNRPYLGICLGLQLLFSESREYGQTKGFNIFEGIVEKLPRDVKIPHMGWNQVLCSDENEIFRNIKNNSYFYFDHSYYVVPAEKTINAGITEYGIRFTSAVQCSKIWGVQFHPEKSGDAGFRILRNFIKQCSQKE